MAKARRYVTFRGPSPEHLGRLSGCRRRRGLSRALPWLEKVDCSVGLNFDLHVSIPESPVQTDAPVRERRDMRLRHVLNVEVRQHYPDHRDSPIGNRQAGVAVPVFFERLQRRDSVVGLFQPCRRLQALDAPTTADGWSLGLGVIVLIQRGSGTVGFVPLPFPPYLMHVRGS